MNIKHTVLSVCTVFLAIFFTLATAYAQEVTTVPAMLPTPTPVDYQLPYPGMLPDNPLYFLKVFRDSLTTFFLSKPLDKADFYLLQSDKNVQASYLLVTQHQGKTELAFKTFSQAQDYFDQAITQTQDAKKQGYSTQEITDKLSAANQKHVQILQAIAQQTHQTGSQVVKQSLSHADTLAKEIKSL